MGSIYGKQMQIKQNFTSQEILCKPIIQRIIIRT